MLYSDAVPALPRREYLADLEKQLAKAGGKIVTLDEDGNPSVAAGASATATTK